MMDIAPYRRVLGDRFEQLPDPVQAFHQEGAHRVGKGRVKVDRGGNILAAGLADLFGFPKETEESPITVTVTCREGTERWVREIAGKSFHSTMKPSADGTLWERFGPVSGGIILSVEDNRLVYRVPRWRLFGFAPVPAVVMPKVLAWEAGDGANFRFFVEITLPLFGLLVRYQGILDRIETADPANP